MYRSLHRTQRPGLVSMLSRLVSWEFRIPVLLVVDARGFSRYARLSRLDWLPPDNSPR